MEKATEPLMDRARQIKEEVNQATGEIKAKVDKNNEIIRNKTGKMGREGREERVEINDTLLLLYDY